MSKLLIVADIEAKCAATPRGLRLAEEMDLVPEVVAFTYADINRLKVDKEQAADIKSQLLTERRNSIKARVAKFAGDDNRIKVNVVWAESIHEWIAKRASGDYAAVVKSRHQSESFAHVSTDWHLLRNCPVPVLLVNRKKWKSGSTVMATVDLDASSSVKQKLNVDVITAARHYAEILDAKLHVLCVIDVPTLLSDLDLIDPKSYAKKRKDDLLPMVTRLAEETGLPESVFKFKRGPVAKTIVSEASALNAQLVAMGTVGRRGVKAQVLGNTVEEALHLLKTDTLTIKP